MPPPRDVKKSESLAASVADDEKRIVGNRYRVEKKLGSGNFGTAFLVTDLKDNNEMKVLKEVSVGDMEADESIESVHEANLLSKLDHPYILKYQDSFLDGDYFCIVTEYCEGGDLDVRFKKLKKENKRLSEEQVLDWTVQLLSALHYMHSRRVLHRDLKARNIFLRKEMVKIGDFGISRILQGTMDMASTFTGTPYYMSPEVLKHEGYNSKSDIWSIGCLIYEMCTFTHAFEGQGLMGVMYKIVEGRTPEIPSSYSRELNFLVKKIFRKDPAARPSTTELLKEPIIANHIKGMIERLKSNQIEDLDSTMVIRNDRAEIQRAMSGKISLRELQMQRQPLPPLAENNSTTSSTATQVQAPVAKAPAQVKATPLVPKQAQAALVPDDHDDNQDISIRNTVRPKTSGPTSSSSNMGKELTPKERMLQNKLKKADAEAAKLGQTAKENYEERLLRQSLRREATLGATHHTLRPSNPSEYLTSQTYKVAHGEEAAYNQPYEQQYQPQQPYEYYQPPVASSFSGRGDEYEGTLLKTLQPNPDGQYYYDSDPYNDQLVSSTLRKQQIPVLSNAASSGQPVPLAPLSPPIKINPYDARPIQPMKAKIENIAFDEEGIPTEPNMTNKYYEPYANDFESDSSPERKPTTTTFTNKSLTKNSMSRTVVPNRNRAQTARAGNRGIRAVPTDTNPTSSKTTRNQQLIAGKTISNSQPRASVAAKKEYEQLIDAMQNVLITDKNEASEMTFGDDKRTSVFGAKTRDTKIQNLRAQAIRSLGPETFEKVYSYLKDQRKAQTESSGEVDEGSIFNGLKQLTTKTTDCFLVEQLIFLESNN